MAALTREDVEDIARLARLALAPAEIEALRAELTAILDHVADLQSVDTTDIEPMTHAVPMSLRLRADEVEPSLPVEIAMAGAPDKSDDCFRVPSIIATATPAKAGGE